MTEENTNIQHLLTHIAAINKKYEQIAEITGENFNVFKILGLTTNEVRTHSAFIAELLDPRGSHGCKDTFLKLFIEKLQGSIKEQTKGSNENGNQILERIKKFICSDKCKAYVEYHIGEINEDRTVGGRIDILLQNPNKHEIIIENKIYAYEQENQLIRYYNYNTTAPIVYLTLRGEKPNSIKAGEKELVEFHDYICLSYEKDILNWLKRCLKDAVNRPILRETITQYINIVKHLTNQTINDDMEKEMINEIIKSPENIIASIEVANNINNVKKAIFENFKIQLAEICTEIMKKHRTNVSVEFKNEIPNYYSGFYFCFEVWSTIKIGFDFNGDDDVLEFGIVEKFDGEHIKKEKAEEIKKLIINSGIIINYSSNESWPIYGSFDEDFQDWYDNSDVLIAITNNKLKENVKTKVDTIYKKLKEIKDI